MSSGGILWLLLSVLSGYYTVNGSNDRRLQNDSVLRTTNMDPWECSEAWVAFSQCQVFGLGSSVKSNQFGRCPANKQRCSWRRNVVQTICAQVPDEPRPTAENTGTENWNQQIAQGTQTWGKPTAWLRKCPPRTNCNFSTTKEDF